VEELGLSEQVNDVRAAQLPEYNCITGSIELDGMAKTESVED
jgi:hypothetical protein